MNRTCSRGYRQEEKMSLAMELHRWNFQGNKYLPIIKCRVLDVPLNLHLQVPLQELMNLSNYRQVMKKVH
jgi:hypothetical protein